MTSVYGYTGTLWADCDDRQVELKRERVAGPGGRMRPVCAGALVHYEQTVRTLPEIAILTWTPETGMVPSSIAPSVPSMLIVSPSVPQGLTRVIRYFISIWEMTVSIPSSPISLAYIPYRYPG